MSYHFYAVKAGRRPGVYLSWAECKTQVDGFGGAIYKGFNNKDEALAFIGGEVPKPSKTRPSTENRSLESNKLDVPSSRYAFTDGSYNINTGVYGFGGFLIDDDGNTHVLQGYNDDVSMAKMRNVAGEICGSVAAALKAQEIGMKSLTIYYDYLGIEMWVTGKWKTNEVGTKKYHEIMRAIIDSGLKINFVKVKGHSGIPGNELADRLAKESAGVLPANGVEIKRFSMEP